MDSPTTDRNPNALDVAGRRVVDEMRNRYMRRSITVTGNTTLGATHNELRVDAGNGPVTITVPLAALYIAREFVVKKVDPSPNTVTLVRSGSDTIDGQTSVVLKNQWDAVTIKSVV